MEKQIEDKFVHIFDQLDSIECYTNSVVKSVTEIKEDVLELSDFISKIDKAKHDVQIVKHGKWIDYYDAFLGGLYFKCSQCDLRTTTKPYLRYCPGCGAKMDGGAE